jgi:prepilin-type N-terminal cleavage/methylation domain-containing protein
MPVKRRQVQSANCRMRSAEGRAQSAEYEVKNVAPASSFRTSSRRGFTLTEMLVVIGIIILFITMAIPAISAITGTRSISAAENQISAVLARAREEAIGIQDYRGIFFYLDPREDRVVAALVRPADIQDLFVNGVKVIALDTVANRDYLMLPQGIRLQTLYDDPTERYLGFNPTPNSTESVRFGGVILFDGQGRLVSKAYGFQYRAPDPTSVGGAPVPSGMSALLKVTGTNFGPANGNNPLRSQMGLVLFDSATFKSQNFTDGDPALGIPDPLILNPGNEPTEENWLDANSTPILINRFNGTLIRGE